MKVIAIAFLVAASCGGKDEAPPPPPPLTGLAIVDPGIEPRTLLHYQAPKGTRTPLRVTADIEMGDGASKIPWPTVITSYEVSADDVLADSTLKVRYTVTAAEAKDREH